MQNPSEKKEKKKKLYEVTITYMISTEETQSMKIENVLTIEANHVGDIQLRTLEKRLVMISGDKLLWLDAQLQKGVR